MLCPRVTSTLNNELSLNISYLWYYQTNSFKSRSTIKTCNVFQVIFINKNTFISQVLSRKAIKNFLLNTHFNRILIGLLHDVTNIWKQWVFGWHGKQWDFQNNEKTKQHLGHWIMTGCNHCYAKWPAKGLVNIFLTSLGVDCCPVSFSGFSSSTPVT